MQKNTKQSYTKINYIKNDFIMDLFENAIAAIQTGIDDFKSEDERRTLSAIRNIFSGLVLLYKAKLWELSPSDDEFLLIKTDLIYKKEANRIYVTSKKPGQKPKKTINVSQIQDRFKSLEVEVDWKLFEILQKERNEIEHFYSSSNYIILRKAINDAFILISQSIEKHFELDVKEVLGEEYWAVLMENKKIYLAEKAKCTSSLNTIECNSDWVKPYLHKIICEKCDSDLLVLSEHSLPEFNCANLTCRTCGNQNIDLVQAVIKVIADEQFDFEMLQSGWSPVTNCPYCGEESFVRSENECLSCNNVVVDLECRICGVDVDPDELCENNICSYCNYKISKDD